MASTSASSTAAAKRGASTRPRDPRHVRRNSSLQDLSAFVRHFPQHLSWRAQRESFAHEAAQYALWVPFAAGAHYAGMRTLSYLFATWFVLGEAMLVYMHANAKSKSIVGLLRWWHILVVMACAALVVGVPLVGTFKRFVAEYVFFGVIAMACVFPLVPKRLTRDVPDMIYTLGFLTRSRLGRRSDVDAS